MAYAIQSFVNMLAQNEYLVNPLFNQDTKLQNQVISLHQKAIVLRDVVAHKDFPGVIPENLESRIREAVHEAEDAIDKYLTNQIIPDGSNDPSELDLKFHLEEFDSIMAETMMLKHLDKEGRELPACVPPVDSSDPYPGDLNFAGIVEHIEGIEALVRSESSKLQIISIVGREGTGKTVMAQSMFYPVLGKLFVTRVWISFSREFTVRTTIFAFLNYFRKVTGEMRELTDNQLGEIVYRYLKGKKYLIVMDNIWDAKLWDQIRDFFPDDNNGSLIILTTRNGSLADHVSSSRYTYVMPPLDQETSWNLLIREVYGDKPYHPEFEHFAYHFAQICEGSPLALKILGGLLRPYKSSRYFVNLIFDEFSREAASWTDINKLVLCLSYKHLPIHVKPCFLYLGVFPQNYVIRPHEIIRLWIAEGFLTMEDLARNIVEYLARINLLMPSLYNSPNEIDIYTVNDTVRDFCIDKSREDKFLWVKDVDASNPPWDERMMRRVSAHSLSQPFHERGQISPLVRSFLCIGCASLNLAPMLLSMRLLRTLDVFQTEFYQFPVVILQLVLLKFIAFSCHSPLPSSISRLRNLQTLIVRRLPSFRAFVIPSELWKMEQLRHVESKETCVMCCPSDQVEYVLKRLLTLSNLQTIGVTNEFLGKMPNLKELAIYCNSSMSNVLDLACLHDLEKLKCSSDWSSASHNFLSYLTFPNSLREISLSYCKLPAGYMSTIGSLPYLKELKVKKSDFFINVQTGRPGEPEWEIGEGEFLALHKLHMEELNLVTWKVNETSLSNLSFLIVKRCTSLVGMPSTLKGISSLSVHIDKSSPPFLASALQLQLHLRIGV